MIATQAAEAPRLGSLDLSMVIVGSLLLLFYVANRLRGRDLMPRGPAPVAGFGLLDAVAVVVAGTALQLLIGYAAILVGVDAKPTLLALSYVGPVGVAILAWRVYLVRRDEHGPRGEGALAGVLSWLALFPVVAAALVAWSALLRALGYDWQEQGVLTELRSNLPLFLVVAVALAPVTEEVIFRGMLFSGLRRRVGVRGAMVVSAAAFALVHLNLHVAPAIFVLGVALAYVYERTGTLAAPIAFHAVFNAWTFLGEALRKAVGEG